MGKFLQYGLRQVFRNFNTKIILLVFLFLSGLTISFLYLSYTAHINSSIEREFVRLECATKPLSAHIDGAIHERMLANYPDSSALVADLNSSGFNAIREQLQRVKRDLSLETDLYTLVLNPLSGKLEFAVTSSPQVFYRHVWEEPHVENFERYSEGAQFGPYTDENGTWLSCFHPVKVDGRTVAIVQADKRFDVFITDARAAFRKTLLIFLAVFLISTLVLLRWINLILAQEEKVRERMLNHAEIIDAKNKSIMDSLRVADRIQQTVLPDLTGIRADLPEFGVMYEPKDVVSGDFYWYEKVGEKLYIAAGDCTGHGIPGAMMSMMASSAMYYVLKRYDGDLANMLTGLDTIARRYWHDENESYAGMDLALCCYDTETGSLSYSSAMRPIVVVRNGELLSLEGDKAGIGSPWQVQFTERQVDVEPGDSVYMFSDGYVDQFGGDDSKRYMSARFRDFLEQIQEHPIQEQIYLLRYEFHLWKAQEEQIDDVVILAFDIPDQVPAAKAA